MFVKRIRSNKGILQVGKYGIDRIDVDEEQKSALCYTAGGNIFAVKVMEILDKDNKVISNSRNYHKNLF